MFYIPTINFRIYRIQPFRVNSPPLPPYLIFDSYTLLPKPYTFINSINASTQTHTPSVIFTFEKQYLLMFSCSAILCIELHSLSVARIVSIP